MSRKRDELREKFIVILDNIRSVQNVSSISKTSGTSGVDKLYLCGITPTFYPQRAAEFLRISAAEISCVK